MADTITGRKWFAGEACRVTRMTGLPGDAGRQPVGEADRGVVAELLSDIVRGEVEALIARRGPSYVRVRIETRYGPRTRCFSYQDGYDWSGTFRLMPADAATAAEGNGNA